MVRKYILQASPIDEIFTPIEAVYWAAFRLYPCSMTWDEEVPRSISDLYDKNFRHPNFVVPQDAYPGSSLRRATFLPEPEHPYIPEPEFYENLKLRYQLSPLDQNDAEYASSRAAWATYRAEMLIWRDWYETTVAPFHHEIFQKLSRGELRLYGVRTFLIRDGLNPLEWAEHDFTGGSSDYWEEDEQEQLCEVPTNAIRFDGINWDECVIHGPGGVFHYVHVRQIDLYKIYPEPKSSFLSIPCRDGSLILEECVETTGEAVSSRRGRPPAYDWDAFHVEVARYIRLRGLPEKQEAFIAAMAEWCRLNWKREVPRSTIQPKISAYYKAEKS